MSPARTPLFDRLVVTCPNANGGIGVLDGGCVFFLEGMHSTGICTAGECVLVGWQPDRVAVVERGRAEVLEPPFPDIHDLACIEGRTYAVATTANEVIAFDRDGKPLDRWRLPGGDDACHLNCLVPWRGGIAFTTFGDFTEPRGYKGRSDGTGYLRDLRSGERLVEGLTHPHNPTPFRDGLIIANSGTKELLVYDQHLKLARSASFAGYLRGVHVGAQAIYVGISRFRARGVDGPKTARLLALDPDTLEELAWVDFPAEEIYAIAALDDALTPLDVLGPLSRLLATGRDA